MGLLATLAEGAATSGAEAVLFWVFATIALGSAVAVVALRNVVHAALMLVVNLLSVAALYLGLQSAFLSIVQVIVYAGAIVVLFLFVIMLLGVDRDDLLGTRTPYGAAAAITAGVALAGAFLVVVGADSLTAASACGSLAGEGAADAVACAGLDGVADDSVSFVGAQLFTRWTFAFEASALLLVVATLGALVLGRRRDPHLEDDLAPTAPVPDADDLATADLRPGQDATATLEDAADRDPPDTAEERSAGTTFKVEGGRTAPDTEGGRTAPDVEGGDTGRDA
jgi:NADH-quinone oxidoreductase subunit J